MVLHRMRALCALAALLLQASVWAQSAAPSAPAASSAARADIHPLTQTALQQGAFQCVGRINQVGNFLDFGNQAGALVMAPAGLPDQRLLSYSMEIPTERTAVYVSANFAPNPTNGCGAVYEAVAYWAQGCDALAAKEFAGLKRIGLLKTAITVLEGGVATKVFLMPAGCGCLSIKKEVVL